MKYQITYDNWLGSSTEDFLTLQEAVVWGDKKGPDFIKKFGIQEVKEVPEDEINQVRKGLG